MGSTAPLSVRPIGTTIIAARMKGEYRYVTLAAGQSTATDEQLKSGGEDVAELGTFHFIFPEDQRVLPFRSTDSSTDDEDDEEDDEDDDDEPTVVSKSKPSPSPAVSPVSASSSASPASPASTIPGDIDMETGDINVKLNDMSDATTDNIRVQVSSSYRPERSDNGLDKHCFAYNIRITNESNRSVQLVS